MRSLFQSSRCQSIETVPPWTWNPQFPCRCPWRRRTHGSSSQGSECCVECMARRSGQAFVFQANSKKNRERRPKILCRLPCWRDMKRRKRHRMRQVRRYFHKCFLLILLRVRYHFRYFQKIFDFLLDEKYIVFQPIK